MFTAWNIPLLFSSWPKQITEKISFFSWKNKINNPWYLVECTIFGSMAFFCFNFLSRNQKEKSKWKCQNWSQSTRCYYITRTSFVRFCWAKWNLFRFILYLFWFLIYLLKENHIKFNSFQIIPIIIIDYHLMKTHFFSFWFSLFCVCTNSFNSNKFQTFNI